MSSSVATSAAEHVCAPCIICSAHAWCSSHYLSTSVLPLLKAMHHMCLFSWYYIHSIHSPTGSGFSLVQHTIIIIIIIIGTTARFQPMPSFEVSTNCLCPLQHFSNFSPLTSWRHPSRRPPISTLACPFAFFLLLLQ